MVVKKEFSEKLVKILGSEERAVELTKIILDKSIPLIVELAAKELTEINKYERMASNREGDARKRRLSWDEHKRKYLQYTSLLNGILAEDVETLIRGELN